jgi:alkylation response protein AidB-like acyl-CoA dehydrogenase
VRFELSSDQEALHDAVTRAMVEHCSPDRVRVVEAEGGFDAALWGILAGMGLSTMTAPEPAGAGASLVDAQIVCEATGRALAPVPLVQAMVASRVLAASAPNDVTRIADGAVVAIVPTPGVAAPFLSIADLALSVDVTGRAREASGAGWRVHDLTGSRDGITAVRLTSQEPAGIAPELAQRSPGGRPVPGASAAGLDELRALEAARLVGVAAGALDVAVRYCNERVQFGRRIGAFQALAHRLADHATVVDAARLLALRAGWALESGAAGSGDARSAYRWCGEVARAVAADAVQVHGGYGFTLEYDPQLFLRRARAWGSWLGDEADDWAAVADDRLRGPRVPTAVATSTAAEASEGFEFSVPESAARFGGEVGDFLAAHMTPEVHHRMRETGTFHDAGFHRALAARGWIGLSWPGPDGRRTHSAYDSAVFAEEAGYAHAPVDGLQTANIVAQTLLRVGTPDQQRRFIEPIRRGELLVCLGFTEPEAGSDVAAATTRAVRDGDEWLLTGSKMFTTLAHVSDFVFLLARTDPEVPKHEGLTVFLVPLDAPGVEIRPVATLGGERTNATFYDAVRVRDADRVGEVDGGWSVMALALDVERAGADYAAQARRVLDECVGWARTTTRGPHPVIDQVGVRERLARCSEDIRAAEMLAWRVVWLAAVGHAINVEASMAKLLGAVVFQRVCEECLDVMGPAGIVSVGDDPDGAAGFVEEAWRHSKVTSIYGGTNEVQRNIIGRRGLGLPRE